MADQFNDNRTTAVNASEDYGTPASSLDRTGDDTAYPNHGIDGKSGNDAAKGGVIGAIGGAAVGLAAGGPVGAVIGAVVGGIASDAGVAAVDRVDNDNSPGERDNNAVNRDAAYNSNAGVDDYGRPVDASVNVTRDYVDKVDAVPSNATTANAVLGGQAEYDANGNRIR